MNLTTTTATMASAERGRAPSVTVVVGNPKPQSRTRAVGVAVAERCAAAVFAESPQIDVIELGELAGVVLGWGDQRVAAAKELLLGADLVVVTSPVFKASVPGLLKAFLDQFGRDELDARAVVPVMVGAGAAHTLAVEHQLRPVLIEIGACCPTRGLYVLDSEIDALDGELEEWIRRWGSPLAAVVNAAGDRRRATEQGAR